MPTYEKVVDGVVVERSVTFTGKPHDLQLSMAASNVDSPWFAVNDQGERVKLNPMPTFVEPAVPTEQDDEPETPDPDPMPAATTSARDRRQAKHTEE